MNNAIEKIKSKYVYCLKSKRMDDDPNWPIYHVCNQKKGHEGKHKCSHCKEEWTDES